MLSACDLLYETPWPPAYPLRSAKDVLKETLRRSSRSLFVGEITFVLARQIAEYSGCGDREWVITVPLGRHGPVTF